MNNAQITNLHKMLVSRHYERRIKYMLYRYPQPVADWRAYLAVSGSDLADSASREAILRRDRDYYHRQDAYYNSHKIQAHDRYVRTLSFSKIAKSYGDYAWFFGIVGDYRIARGVFRIMLKGLNTFMLDTIPVQVEDHIWLDTRECRALSDQIKVGLGDVLVFLAKPISYHYIDNYHKRLNVIEKHGIMKRGLGKPILARAYYPAVARKRVQYVLPYQHGKRYLLGISRQNFSVGSDIMPKDKALFDSNQVDMFYTPLYHKKYRSYRVSKYIQGRLKGWYHYRTLVAMCHQGLYVADKIVLLYKRDSMQLWRMTKHVKSNNGWYTFDHHSVKVLMPFTTATRAFNQFPRREVGNYLASVIYSRFS